MWEIKWDGTEQMKNLRQGGDYPSLQTVDKAALGCKSQSHFSFIKCIAFKIEFLYDFLFS